MMSNILGSQSHYFGELDSYKYLLVEDSLVSTSVQCWQKVGKSRDLSINSEGRTSWVTCHLCTYLLCDLSNLTSFGLGFYICKMGKIICVSRE